MMRRSRAWDDLFAELTSTATAESESDKKEPWRIPDDAPEILRDPQPFPQPPSGWTPMVHGVPWANRERRLSHAWEVSKKILWAAYSYFKPIRVYACFSGGYDSAAAVLMTLQTLPWAKQASSPDHGKTRVLHINTGIGIEATRQYVRDCCAGGPILDEIKTPISYEELVLGKVPGYAGGFPGPPMHGLFYNRLKERAIRIAVRQAKELEVGDPRKRKFSNVMFVSGIRHDESKIRAGYQRCISKVGSQVWVNPLYWATVDDFREIRKLLNLPANPVKDKLGMSGECTCGAYAERGELERIHYVCPDTANYIRGLEKKVRAAGFDWDWEDPGPPKDRNKPCPQVKDGIYIPDQESFRPMCASCEKTKAVDMQCTPTPVN